MESTHGALIVSWDFSHDTDKHILLVGRKTPKHDVEVINAFQGKEAHDIFDKLTTKRKRSNMIDEDDIPKLTENEKKCPDLMIIHRGWVFRFAYGYLWAPVPTVKKGE